MRRLGTVFCSAVVVMALCNCGGGGGGGTGPSTSGPTSEHGARFHLVSGSSVTADVYGGPVPNDVWAVVQSPASYGYVKIGSLGPASALTSEITGTGDYQYILLLVTYQAVSNTSTSYVRIDAIQRLSDGMYMTGMTNSGYVFASSNDYNQDEMFQLQTNPPYWNGVPDGKYVALFGFAFMPLIDWAP